MKLNKKELWACSVTQSEIKTNTLLGCIRNISIRNEIVLLPDLSTCDLWDPHQEHPGLGPCGMTAKDPARAKACYLWPALCTATLSLQMEGWIIHIKKGLVGWRRRSCGDRVGNGSDELHGMQKSHMIWTWKGTVAKNVTFRIIES